MNEGEEVLAAYGLNRQFDLAANGINLVIRLKDRDLAFLGDDPRSWDFQQAAFYKVADNLSVYRDAQFLAMEPNKIGVWLSPRRRSGSTVEYFGQDDLARLIAGLAHLGG